MKFQTTMCDIWLCVCATLMPTTIFMKILLLLYIKLKRVCAIDIYEAITGCEEELGISLNNLRGRGCNGALINEWGEVRYTEEDEGQAASGNIPLVLGILSV